jgi:hypothetical protein
MIGVAVLGLVLFGSQLYARRAYHRRLVESVEEYRRAAEAASQGAAASERGAAEAATKAAGDPGGRWGRVAEARRKDADWRRRQAEYFAELSELSRHEAARPWYRSTDIPLPPHLARPPLP